jgi:hypothetical protein
MLRLINNKRIDLTDTEYKLYEDLCMSYNRDNFQGKDLFNDLFETNEQGVIIFLKPPTQTFSMEIILFLQNIMVHQHLRLIYSEHEQAMAEFKNMKSELTNILNEIKSSSK